MKLLPAEPTPNPDLRSLEAHPVIRFDCAADGFVGFNVAGTGVQCGRCGRQVFGPMVDLLLSDITNLRPLQ